MFKNFVLTIYIFFAVGAFSEFMKLYFYGRNYVKEQIKKGKEWTARARRVSATFSSVMGVIFITFCPIINALYFFASCFGGEELLIALETKLDDYLEDP